MSKAQQIDKNVAALWAAVQGLTSSDPAKREAAAKLVNASKAELEAAAAAQSPVVEAEVLTRKLNEQLASDKDFAEKIAVARKPIAKILAAQGKRNAERAELEKKLAAITSADSLDAKAIAESDVITFAIERLKGLNASDVAKFGVSDDGLHFTVKAHNNAPKAARKGRAAGKSSSRTYYVFDAAGALLAKGTHGELAPVLAKMADAKALQPSTAKNGSPMRELFVKRDNTVAYTEYVTIDSKHVPARKLGDYIVAMADSQHGIAEGITAELKVK